jgi:hypothetical protein
MDLFGTPRDAEYAEGMEAHLQQLGRSASYVANNFAKYCKRQELTRFLVCHELFKLILNVKRVHCRVRRVFRQRCDGLGATFGHFWNQ